MNNLEKAKVFLLKAAMNFPKSEIVQMNYAMFLEEQKNYIDAFKFYDRCNKANAYIEKCWLGYTTTSFQLLKFSDALNGLKKSCNFNRKHSIIGRKAASQARLAKQMEWATKLEKQADICGN